MSQPTLISGGFPCQPHSCAGKRGASGDERDLWPELRRVICEIKPRWFLGENVAGLRSSEDGRFFGGILRDLAAMGYVVGWGSWEAAGVGAPHHRERIFIVAHSTSERPGTGCDRISGRSDHQKGEYIPSNFVIGKGPGIGIIQNNSDDPNSHKSGCTRTRVPEAKERNENADNCRIVANSHDPTTPRQREDSGGLYPLSEPGGFNCDPWKESWIEVATRLCRVDDGVPRRVDRLKCLGNAVVPAQVYPILKAIAEIERGDVR